MQRARQVLLAATTGVLAAGLVVANALPAAAAPGAAPAVAEPQWRAGHFEVTGAPVLPADSPPDGWLCHLQISCRPGVLATAGLTADDARPIAETREQAPVRVECEFGSGNWVKVHFGAGAVGWVAADAVDIVASGRTPAQCGLGDW
ncbi:MAG TPA: hypothetical protein VEZ42_06480 [Pseudonocardia sp.]|nr:hypothetical protein [Pseudonocardia sp.]